MKKVLHLIDGLAVVFGIFLLFSVLSNLSPAEAAIAGDLLPGKANQPLIALLGFTFTTLPVSRRVAYHALFTPQSVAEFQDIGHALQRIALLQRVQAGNLYLADMDDAGFKTLFNGEQGLWTWLGPAYNDEALRRQIHPSLLVRLDAMAKTAPAAWPQA